MTRRGSHRRYERTDRVNEAVQHALADELERLSDPRLELVTITGVEVTTDLSYATVYWSAPADDDDGSQAAAGLRSAASHLRGVLGRQLRLRVVPELRFREDPAIVQGRRIEEILREIRTEESS